MWRGALSCMLVAVLVCLASSRAAETPDTYLVIKLHTGLVFKGAVVKDDGETLVLMTTVGERKFRRTDVVDTRKTLTEAEKQEIQNAVAVAKERPAAQPGAAERPGERFAERPAAAPSGARVLDSEPPLSSRRVFGEGMGAHESAYERMDRQLSKKISLEFVDTPLVDTISFLSQLTGLNLIVSPKVREANPPVTLRVSDMEAATVIRWVTRLTETHAEVKDEAIFINDKASKAADDEEKQEVMALAASMGTTVELPPEGVAMTDADRVKIALALWEKENPKVQDFPGPDISIGAGPIGAANPFGQ